LRAVDSYHSKMRTERASALYRARRASFRLMTGCATLDSRLGGCLPWTGVTEVCGEAGCGKTQLVLRLLATTALQGFRAVHICTEGGAPLERLDEIVRECGVDGSSSWSCECKEPEVEERKSFDGRKVDVASILERVLVREIHELVELERCIERDLPRLLRGLRRERRLGPVKLVVVDSLAAILRPEFRKKNAVSEMKTLLTRSLWFLKTSQLLRRLAAEFSCAVVVVNQVSNGEKDKRASLGLTWSNCVNSRIMLSRKLKEEPERKLEVLFSPIIADISCTYYVRKCGVCVCRT